MESRKPEPKDYYAVLGVSPDSDAAEIKKAYRALVQRYHPDRVRGTEEATHASERMIEINEAFAVLGDSKRRAELDRQRKASQARPAPAAAAAPDWEIPVSPAKERSAPAPRRNTAVERSVAKEFLDKVKGQLLQDSAAKFKEEADPGWQWSLLGKTWGGNYWVGLRQVPLLNPNTVKELLQQLSGLMEKRRSGWKSNFFVAIYGFESLQESDMVLKLLRAFANREEHSTTRNLVNIVVLDLNQRRSVLCGKRTGDLHHSSILHTLNL